jgi:hypothetical protein
MDVQWHHSIVVCNRSQRLLDIKQDVLPVPNASFLISINQLFNHQQQSTKAYRIFEVIF